MMTPSTRKFIVGSLGAIGLAVAVGWSIGKVPTEDALLIISPMMTGFFSLLKGED